MESARPNSVENSNEIALTKALLRALDHLNLERSEIAFILGVSESAVSRLYNHERFINPSSKEGELAVLVLRIYKCLTSLFGNDVIQCQQWARNPNRHLNAIPIDLIKQTSGLMKVLNYLEFIQEKI